MEFNLRAIFGKPRLAKLKRERLRRRNGVHACQLLTPLLLLTPTRTAAAFDPEGSGVLVNALSWLQGTLLGTVATVAAVIAVAAVGFMMLTGRINWRHGAIVVLGCFVMFGAASIVGGIRAAAVGG